MKFTYPYRIYLYGIALLFFVTICSIVVIEPTFRNPISIIAVLIIGSISYFFSLWYYREYKRLMGKGVVVEKDSIIINNNKLVTSIYKNEFECIIYSQHLQRFKIHNVIHIFTRDERYFYITREIDNFDKLRKLLKETFPSLYLESDNLLLGVCEDEKELLSIYRDKVFNNS